MRDWDSNQISDPSSTIALAIEDHPTLSAKLFYNLLMVSSLRIYFTVFTTGFCIMVLELVGIRILSPYLGASMYVWTTLIGLILTFLSLGYYGGGYFSQKNPTPSKLSYIVFFASIWIILIVIFKESFLTWITYSFNQIYWQLFLSIIILFAFPSALLGAVSPYAAKLIINNVSTSGLTVGKLYALSTLGSIIGTFLTGFILIPMIGHTKILYLICLILGTTSLLLSTKGYLIKIILLILCTLLMFNQWTFTYKSYLSASTILDTDTAYSRIKVKNFSTYQGTERLLIIDTTQNSAVILENKNYLPFSYYTYYNLMFWNKPVINNVLMIGGAGMGYPRYLNTNFPSTKITVVEIDPKLIDIAQKYMDYQPNPQTEVVLEDGRYFLNKSNEKYDAILFDAFNGDTIPWHLMTKEATQKVQKNLSDDGVVIINTIGSLSGKNSLVPQAIIATYKNLFPFIELFSTNNPPSEEGNQNIIIIASNKKLDFNDNFLSPDSKKLLDNKITMAIDHPTITDDWAPIDSYSFK